MANDYQNGFENGTWRCPGCGSVNTEDRCVSCGAPRVQPGMVKYCPRCGYQNDKSANYCGRCSQKLDGGTGGGFLQKNWKILLIAAVALILAAALLFKPHEHTWEEATCTKPMTCSGCGEISGTTAAHQWAAATCTTPKTCKVCGEESGAAKGHQWQEATCEEPETCADCGLTNGAALGHQWKAATYDAPKTCSVCGATEGTVLAKPAGYTDFLYGSWEKVTLYSGNLTINVYALKLDQKLVQCKEFTLNMSVEMNKGAKCKDWQIWGRTNGSFKKIGNISLPEGNGDTIQRVVFDSPVTVDAIAVTPTVPGGYSWTNVFYLTEIWVKA